MNEAAAVLVPLGGMTMVVVICLGYPLIRLMSKRLDARLATPVASSDTTARLERIEHAIDAISIEVERIAEGQRFTTKLLSERSSGARVGSGGGGI